MPTHPESRTISFVTLTDKSNSVRIAAECGNRRANASGALRYAKALTAHRAPRERTPWIPPICKPWVRVRRARAISCAITTPSSAAASGRRPAACDPATHPARARLAPRWPGLRRAGGCRTDAPTRGWHRNVRGPLAEGVERLEIVERRGHSELGPCLHLVLEAADFLVQIRGGGVCDDADVECGRSADRLSADITPRLAARRRW